MQTGNENDGLAVLCERLRASDRSALEAVFRHARPGLLRYVGGIVRRDALAHDLVQDVFVSLWEARETLDPSQSLQAYLYRMARNRAYRHLRDERGHARKHRLLQRWRAADHADEAAPDHRIDTGLLAERLRRWIDELPERQREALVLSRYHGLSHREVAAVMDVSPRTVNNHIVRALSHLHARVQALEATPSQP